MTARRFGVVALPYAWLLLFFLVPFLIVLKISLAHDAVSIPPYSPLFDHGRLVITGANCLFLLSDPLYWKAYLGAIR